MKNKIFVMGSYVTDLISRTDRLPRPGETVVGQSFSTGAGGKGSNQAAAVARLGGRVTLVTKLGDDEFGHFALEHFVKENINTQYISIDKNYSTGSALIAVDKDSENMIVVTLEACDHIHSSEIHAAKKEIEEAAIVLTQLETNLEAVETTLELAHQYNKPLILNPAPYRDIPDQWLKKVSYITPNETELSEMTNLPVESFVEVKEAAKTIYEKGVNNVIVTLGKKGALLYNDDYKGKLFESYSVKAIDTTGAGDAFNGGLAYGLANNFEITEAIKFGNATAALAVTKEGTAQSMPTFVEVETFLGK